MADSRLNIAELDFQTIKQNLKTFLQAQQEFSDYDFDGSGMSVLLDILAYNTHYGAYYDNVVANESRLHSAQLRESVVSKAKELGYVPYPRKAAVAFVQIAVKPSDALINNISSNYGKVGSTILLPKYKKFTTSIDGKLYEFLNMEDYVLEWDNISKVYRYYENGDIASFPIYQGTMLEMNYVVDYSNPNQLFTIPNGGADYNHMIVSVQTSLTSTDKTQFFYANTFPEYSPTNNAYWIWEIEKELYMVEFGDGVLAKKLQDGNFINIKYLLTDGASANGANDFGLAGTIEGLSDVTITTTNKAFGGASIESIESIKFNAPKAYSTQNRAVTESDYKFIVKREFPAAESIMVWGGEKNTPPEYGKVFLSIKPQGGFYLTPTEKLYITNELVKAYNMVSILPEIVDPDFTFILLKTVVSYNPDETTLNSGEIEQLVRDAIESYNQNDIGQFGADYLHSQVMCLINDAEPSILSNLSSIILQKKVFPAIGTVSTYTLEFNDALIPESLYMDGFVIEEPVLVPNATYSIVDNGLGELKMVRKVTGNADYIVGTAGSVDYATGFVTITNFNPISVDEIDDILFVPVVKMVATPVDEDVEVERNSIINIIDVDVTIKPIVVK